MLDEIDRLSRHLQGVSVEGFAADEVLQGNVLHRLAVIGEAAGQVPEQIRDRYPVVPWRRLRETRNVISHVYFGVNLTRIWRLAKVDLPQVAAELRAILAARGEAED